MLSGLLVAVLFPPFAAVGLAWVAVVPLLAAVWSVGGGRAGWRGFGLGWLAGVVSFGVQLRWLGEVSWVGAVLLPMYLAMFWGMYGAYAATLGNPWRQRVGADADEGARVGVADAVGVGVDPRAVMAARRVRIQASVWPAGGEVGRSLRVAVANGAVWAGLEWLRGWLFTGFGWNGLGVAFHDTVVIAQAADLLGVAGLSLMLVFFQAVLVQVGMRIWKGIRDGRRRPRWDFGVAVGVVGAVASYGMVRMALEDARKSVRLKALLVQLNIPQEAAQMTWDDLEIHRGYEDETVAALEKVSRVAEDALKGAADGAEVQVRSLWPDWVVWPESSMRGRILRGADGSWAAHRANLDTVAVLREAGRFSLVFGAIELEAEAQAGGLIAKPGGGMYNSMGLLGPDDDLQTYRKNHLVIFGETIPFENSLPFLKRIYEQQSGAEYLGSFRPGGSVEPLHLAAGGRAIGVIPSVCFEDTVPRLKRLFVRPGPQVIVNITNDGWFHQSAAAAQHFANARFRAIELRRPMLRSANTGVSAAVDSCGSTVHPDGGRMQVLADAGGSTFTRGTLLAELDVPLEPGFSLYVLVGDFGVIGLAGVALGFGWLRRRGEARGLAAGGAQSADKS